MKEKILMAEDEAELAKALKTILEFSDYDVTNVYNGKDALEKTQQENFDLIILDVMMPVMDGIEALKKMRSSGVNTPVMLLTAKSQVEDKVDGLDAGANDYLTKPFNRKELLARVRALLRINEEKKEQFSIGNIIFNKESSQLSNAKTNLHLNHKECEIMEMLLKNQNRTITAKELNKKVWENDSEDETAVSMYMSYLQDKFKALDANISISKDNGYILETIL
ncbi:MAG: response regulator transcription factor [Clostridia bacterium]|nr:response regulator transcription factor [Clostridia bacterium]